MTLVATKNYEHQTGFHCGSSALRSLLRHFGHELSEPMCLGLGLGLSFLRWDESSPSRLFQSRNPTLEEDFFATLEIDAPMRRHKRAENAWPGVKALVHAGHPAMIQVDIRHMPYFNTKVHFGGHKVLVVGYDEEKGTALISDSEFAQMQTISLEELARARTDPTPPWDLENQWWNLDAIARIAPLAEAAPRAITGCAERIVRDRTGMFGIEAMRRLLDDLPSWEDAADWSWCARFGYQIIERRGTGGGGFREKYADFLEEAKPYDPRIEKLGLAGRMRAISGKWTDFATLLKAISERDAPSGFGEAARLFGEIAESEDRFFKNILV